MLAGPPPGRLLDSDEPMYKFVQALPEVCCYAADTACFLGGRSPCSREGLRLGCRADQWRCSCTGAEQPQLL